MHTVAAATSFSLCSRNAETTRERGGPDRQSSALPGLNTDLAHGMDRAWALGRVLSGCPIVAPSPPRRSMLPYRHIDTRAELTTGLS